MKVTKITLDNFQSYDHEEIAFDDGVSLLHGDNGSGKSTILRAIFAGLFQTKMSQQAASDFNSIGELVTRTEETGGVTILFEVGTTEYELEWTISVEDPSEDEPTGKTDTCVLDSPSFNAPINGVTAVREAIQSDIVGMNARAFTNSVYVQQDEVMQLIAADKRERQEIFDDLLGLSKLDGYIERTVSLRREAKSVRREAANRRDEIEAQLNEEYPDRDELVNRQHSLGSALDEARDTRESLSETQTRLKNERDTLEDRIESYDEVGDERDDIVSKIERLDAKQSTEEAAIETLKETIRQRKLEKYATQEDIRDINAQVDEYELDSMDEATAAENTLNERYVSVNRTETETSQRVTTKQTAVEDAEERVASCVGELRELYEELNAVDAKLKTVRETREETREQLEAAVSDRDAAVRSFLPETDAPDAISQDSRELVEDRIRQLDRRREAAGNEETRLRTEKSNAQENIERLEETVAQLEGERREAIDALPEEVAGSTGDGTNVSTMVTTANELRAAIETVTVPTVTAGNLETIRDSTIPELQASIATTQENVVAALVDLNAQAETLEHRIQTQQHVTETGECPICEQSVSETHDTHEHERRRLEEDLGDVEPALLAARQEREHLTEDVELLRELRTVVDEAILANATTEYDERIARERTTLEETREQVDELTGAIEQNATRKGELGETIELARENVLASFDAVASQQTALEQVESDVDELEADRTRVIEQMDAGGEQFVENKHEVVERRAELTDATDAHETAVANLERVGATLGLVREATTLHEEYDTHESVIESKTREQQDKDDLVRTIREQRESYRTTKRELEAELAGANLDEMRADRDQKATALAETEADLAAVRDRVDELTGEIATVENKLETYDGLASRIAELDGRMSWAQGVVGEMNELIEMYEQIKAQLREDNIQLINAYANEVFRDLYASSSYERVVLEDDYAIQLVKTDGTWISPNLSSGGESAIINIALRAGLYRTIAERTQGNASGLPPFILDEPTTFLDDGHVKELESVLQSIKQWDVSQLLVVSHDESLIDAADYEFEVSKNPATDQSTCTRKTLSQSS
jgi:DNA repair exonuclease SbcCD ATPase subunit